MSEKRENKEKKGLKLIAKVLVIAIFLGCVCLVINLAPNFIRNEIKDKINLIINNNDVTSSLKFDMYVEDDNIYIATKDIANFFDENIFYDNMYDQIITSSNTKLGVLPLEKNDIFINGTKIALTGKATKKDGQFYLPFSELTTLYNVEVNYDKESNIVTIDSLDREQKRGNITKNTNIKYKPTNISKNLEKVNKGDSVIVIDKDTDGWIKVRTKSGIIGYVKDVANIYTAREKMEEQKQIEGTISLVWDYYYSQVPDRTGTTIKGVNVVSPSFVTLEKLGKGDINVKIGADGQKYINWAHNNGYKVWAMVQNDGMKSTTSEILNDYKLREKLINNILQVVNRYNLDGINIDFENMNESDKDMFTRFLIELAPRLKEYGKVLSVDVTAPDGSPEWSLCYNRNAISKVADYIIFMAYDQYGLTSTTAGTTAGADWVEVNINKFIGSQEEVSPDKLILGMPFYTRLWYEKNGKVTSDVYSIKNIDSAIPSSANRVWEKDLKQYYVEYQKNGKTYKMWIEDEKSISEKCDLVNKYKLAGGAYWQKDMETASIWNVISEKLNVK